MEYTERLLITHNGKDYCVEIVTGANHDVWYYPVGSSVKTHAFTMSRWTKRRELYNYVKTEIPHYIEREA